LNALEKLRAKQHQQVELRFGDITATSVVSQQKREREKRNIDTLFDEYLQWIEDTMTPRTEPTCKLLPSCKERK